MSTMAILHDVTHAEHVVQHRLEYTDSILVSTHAAVNDYLSSEGIDCENMSEYVTEEEFGFVHNQSVENVAVVLAQLDDELAGSISAYLENELTPRYFWSLYRVLGRHAYLGLLKINVALVRILEVHRVDHVHYFQSAQSSSLFSTSLDLYDIVLRYSGIPITVVQLPHASTPQSGNYVLEWLQKSIISYGLIRTLQRLFESVLARRLGKLNAPVAVECFRSREKTSKLVVSLDGGWSTQYLTSGGGIDVAHFLLTRKLLTNTSRFQTKLEAPRAVLQKERATRLSFEACNSFDPQLAFIAAVLEHFCNNFDDIVSPLKQFLSIQQRHAVTGGVWVSPPIESNAKTLLVEQMLQLGIPIVGMQHGGNYGHEQLFPRHFDSDYMWCTHWLSYGITARDLKDNFPETTLSCKVFPVGVPWTSPSPRFRLLPQFNRPVGVPWISRHNSSERQLISREPIDIVFPLVQAISFHRNTPNRPPYHLLAYYQRELLVFLNQFDSHRIVVKPFPHFNHSNSAFVELIRTLTNLELVDKMNFVDLIQGYSVGAVLLEFHTSSLYECMYEDLEIIALNNARARLNPTAEAMICKRVHLCNHLEEVKEKVTEFLSGRLETRKDVSFREKYLLPDGNIDKVTKVIRGILA